MSPLNPNKLHTNFQTGSSATSPILPRRYTLTHSDMTGDLFLTIGADYDFNQISSLYTRLMRDEVLAEWKESGGVPSLHVQCHVNGGVVFGFASWRNDIFHTHMPMVLAALRHGDRELFASLPELDEATVWVHFASNQARFNQIEEWGKIKKYKKLP